jgi:hypothetical protein
MERIIPLIDGTFAILVERWCVLPYAITEELTNGFPTTQEAQAWLDAERRLAEAPPRRPNLT